MGVVSTAKVSRPENIGGNRIGGILSKAGHPWFGEIEKE